MAEDAVKLYRALADRHVPRLRHFLVGPVLSTEGRAASVLGVEAGPDWVGLHIPH